MKNDSTLEISLNTGLFLVANIVAPKKTIGAIYKSTLLKTRMSRAALYLNERYANEVRKKH